jgi:hypothetical protein
MHLILEADGTHGLAADAGGDHLPSATARARRGTHPGKCHKSTLKAEPQSQRTLLRECLGRSWASVRGWIRRVLVLQLKRRDKSEARAANAPSPTTRSHSRGNDLHWPDARRILVHDKSIIGHNGRLSRRYRDSLGDVNFYPAMSTVRESHFTSM